LAKRRKRYTKEFKESLVRMINDEGKSATAIAEDVGIHVNTLYRWVSEFKNHGEDAFPGNGNLMPEDAEIRRLKRELADAQEENAILKKAISIFTKPEN
jgi:transposase